MKTTPPSPRKTIRVLALAILAFSLFSCQAVGSVSQPTAVLAPTANPQPPAASTTAPESPGEDDPGKISEGGYDLENPLIGLEELSSFHQTMDMALKGSLNGSTYEEVQHVEREVAGSDHSIQVNATTTTGSPVYLYNARLENYEYAQDQEGESCQAGPAKDDAGMDLNPALRLPAAFGMQETGREDLNGQAAVHYTFDEKSLVDHEGVVKKASGDVWIAEESQAVLKYELTVEIASQDFSGTRIWSYVLDQINQNAPIRLPDTCPPVPANVPVLSGARDILLMPGFLRYSAAVSREDAVTFFHDRLLADGWDAFPGASPDTADLAGDITVLSYSHTYFEGSQVLVIQLSEKDGSLQVIAQTAVTKKPVTVSEQAQPGADPEAMEETPEAEQPPAGEAMLPSDLPVYPDAAIITQAESVMLLESKASAADVIDFYHEELENLGWSVDQKIENAGTTLLMLSRNGEGLMISALESGEGTQVTIAAISE